jgi:hypothetical protein
VFWRLARPDGDDLGVQRDLSDGGGNGTLRRYPEQRQSCHRPSDRCRRADRVWSLISPLARLLAKSLLKGGLIAYREAERVYADAVEAIGDMVQEAQHGIVATTPARGHAEGSSPRAT